MEERFISFGYKTAKGGEKGYPSIIVDRETGINYLYFTFGSGGGLTPLLDKDGKPVITPID